MHNNYYFLRHLTHQLKSNLAGFLIGEVYAQQKNELMIFLHKGASEVIIKAHLDSGFSCLSFPEQASRARRNSVDLFKPANALEVLDIVQIENDRSFYFLLSDEYRLLFKMHGNRSNIVLFRSKQGVEVFKNNLKQDHKLSLEALTKSIDISMQNFEAQHGNYKQICPTFGKAFDSYFLARGYDQKSLNEKYEIFTGLLKNLEHPEFFLHLEANEKPLLRLYQTHKDDQVFYDPAKALNGLCRAYFRDYVLHREKDKIRLNFQKEMRNCESYIKKNQSKRDELMTARSYAHTADLIMANLHLIKPHSKQATLIDFYTQQPVVIDLKPGLSPQLNAQKYYKKSKKQQIEIANLESNIRRKQQQLSQLREQIAALNEATKLRQLKKQIASKGQGTALPYHVAAYMNYEILIGKNARTNEALTFGVAAKEDLFLHAKDSPGSHVIIRHKTNQNFPALVIEKAAAHAAFYSKSKSESFIRVLYAPKKYVRKARGAPAGSVIVTNEKVVLVKPAPLKK
jgi:predicted ribosome quality control (RQC) complex YloA/Tae2 family protein